MRKLAMALGVLVAGTAFRSPAEVKLELRLPLGRVAYQANESIDITVLRSSTDALPATDLRLALGGADGSNLAFSWPLPAEAPAAAAVPVHLRLNARLLRPGSYKVEVAAHGAVARQDFEIHSHVRKSSFRLIDWSSRAKGAEQATMGEESLGFNLLYAAYGGLSPDDSIRGGLDYMWCCTMGGGHQMDLRMECDWSDPYVLQGGAARVARQAFRDRTRPNCVGVHFYDEPGLTWWKHAKTGEMTPHNIPAQDRSFRSAFGREPLQYCDLRPGDAQDVARWTQGGRWKLSFMDAAWKIAQHAVSAVDPGLLSVTQSVYGYSAYGDGYYFNVARSLPVVSGHGGYDDYGGGYYNPLYTFEMGRMRELRKPNWYLPTWYGNIPSDRYRLEQYESFIYGLQGMAKPPDIQVQHPFSTPSTEGVVETNLLMGRLGTVFTTMPPTRPPVAVLYSMSQNLHAQALDRSDNYEGAGHVRERVYLVYLAGLRLHTPIMPIVEEDVLDGTLAAHHRAVVLAGIQSLDPKVVSALEAYAAGGGSVIVSDDCTVAIKGATKLGLEIDRSFFQAMTKAWKENRKEDHAKLNRAGNYLKAAEPVAAALRPRLEAIGVRPVLECDNPEFIATRQASGDVEYLFAVNASYDEKAGGMNSIKPATATIEIPGTVYDAVRGGPASLGSLRFGPGQMRAWARTARPIGGVETLSPIVRNDYTRADDPLHVEIGALVIDEARRPLAGSIPLRITVTDPLQATRYDLYRATDQGILRMSLPLGINDPAGEWQVTFRELLSGRSATSAFAFRSPSQAGAAAGLVDRAIAFGDDRNRIFRFFRTHQDVTVVRGASDWNGPEADRLAGILKPWGIRVKVISAQEAARAREVSTDEMATWCGLHPGKLQPGQRLSPAQVGFAVQGPVVLMGSPEDNPLLKFALENDFLPYKPSKTDFPGRGRGYLAWQRDCVGLGQESVSLLAYDAPGMAEAVGSLYEAQAGLEPLTALVSPGAASVTAAARGPVKAPVATATWTLQLPDRSLIRGPYVLSKDGTLLKLDPHGKILWKKTLEGGDGWGLEVAGDKVYVGATHRLVAFDSSGQTLFETPTPPQVGMALAPDGASVQISTEDGMLTTYGTDGKPGASAKGSLKLPSPPSAPPLAGRLAKRLLVDGGRTATLYWGGTLLVTDPTGAVKAEWRSPDDLAELSWVGSTLVVGSSSGLVSGLEVK
jgi:hypothetical protein